MPPGSGDVRVNDLKDPKFIVVRILLYRHLGLYWENRQSAMSSGCNSQLHGTAWGYRRPFFRLEDGRGLMRERFVSKVRKALTMAGLDCSLNAGHSFRIGAATTAAKNGVQDSLIKTLGRWESAAYTLYIRTPLEVLCGVASILVSEGRSATM